MKCTMSNKQSFNLRMSPYELTWLVNELKYPGVKPPGTLSEGQADKTTRERFVATLSLPRAE